MNLTYENVNAILKDFTEKWSKYEAKMKVPVSRREMNGKLSNMLKSSIRNVERATKKKYVIGTLVITGGVGAAIVIIVDKESN